REVSGAAPCLMIQGTASGVGKSLLAAALCRLFARAGYRVAPFKAQNMALNAAVTADGGEIGRAQAAQAAAAGVEPTVGMNPILLKPEPGDRSQLVVLGRAVASVSWREYARRQPELLPLVAAEDSLDLDDAPRWGMPGSLEIAVVRLPRISNFDDFEPLAAEPGVRVRFARSADELDGADLIVLPGTKSTVADLQWLIASGLGEAIRGAAAAGRPVLGICGGYQILGRTVNDPDRVESTASSTPALGLLPVVTTFVPAKTTVRVRARATTVSRLFA